MIGDQRGEVRGQFHVQRYGIARGLQPELLAAEREFADQHIDGVFPLACPLHDGGDERGAAAAHGARGGVGAGFAFQKNSPQIGVVEIGEVFGVKSCGARRSGGRASCGAGGLRKYGGHAARTAFFQPASRISASTYSIFSSAFQPW